MKEDIRIAKSNIVQLQQENLTLRRDKETLLDEHHRQMQVNVINTNVILAITAMVVVVQET